MEKFGSNVLLAFPFFFWRLLQPFLILPFKSGLREECVFSSGKHVFLSRQETGLPSQEPRLPLQESGLPRPWFRLLLQESLPSLPMFLLVLPMLLPPLQVFFLRQKVRGRLEKRTCSVIQNAFCGYRCSCRGVRIGCSVISGRCRGISGRWGGNLCRGGTGSDTWSIVPDCCRGGLRACRFSREAGAAGEFTAGNAVARYSNVETAHGSNSTLEHQAPHRTSLPVFSNDWKHRDAFLPKVGSLRRVGPPA